MVNSMTGFGRGVAQNNNYSITVELKSVNHRFLELHTRLPKQLSSCEDRIKKQLQTYFSRGKIDSFVSIEQIISPEAQVKVDKELAMAYHIALTNLSEYCSLQNNVTLSEIAKMPGVFTVEYPENDVEEMAALLQDAVAQAAQQMNAMRQAEGDSLAADLSSRMKHIEQLVEDIAHFAPNVVVEQKKRLEQRIADLLNNITIDEAKLANEVAFFADKVDITEELTRLNSHIRQFGATLLAQGSIGRKLEFILQEMQREINTIGSKSNALDINKLVIEVKSELEKIREQIQNVE